jgi:N-acetylmuramoyl-L-alanine amidase
VVGYTGKIAQCVKNKNIAWHAGNWKYNCHSIGIEHAGYVGNSKWFSKRMYHASARLSAWCCIRHKIPADRKHILGHAQVPGATHSDPGKYWNWKKYMRLVKWYRRRLN